MVKEETWSVSIQRIRGFFRMQDDVTEENVNCFVFGTCRIILTELKPKCMGAWSTQRTRIHLEGSEADAEQIYYRFFIQFLSAGG